MPPRRYGHFEVGPMNFKCLFVSGTFQEAGVIHHANCFNEPLHVRGLSVPSGMYNTSLFRRLLLLLLLLWDFLW